MAPPDLIRLSLGGQEQVKLMQVISEPMGLAHHMAVPPPPLVPHALNTFNLMCWTSINHTASPRQLRRCSSSQPQQRSEQPLRPWPDTLAKVARGLQGALGQLSSRPEMQASANGHLQSWMVLSPPPTGCAAAPVLCMSNIGGWLLSLHDSIPTAELMLALTI